jgi:glycerol-3-phosphate dehydrogenase (NAD(P)+)
VTLYFRDEAQARATIAARENRRYLQGVTLPASIRVATDVSALRADVLFAATPVAALASLVSTLHENGVRAPLVSLGKGFVAAPGEAGGYTLPNRRLAPRWPHPVGAVSGPTFALEVARGLPTALVVATSERRVTEQVVDLVRGESLRAYASNDLVGVELGGALKNVFAIAAGASDGLNFGDNARAALITRGLAEAARLSAALGGRPQTLTGLAGLGDLVLTCTGDLSRNRQVGLALARGGALPSILAAIGHVAEGVAAARAARELAGFHGVDMPIVDAVHRVLYEGVAPRDAVLALLAREPRDE